MYAMNSNVLFSKKDCMGCFASETFFESNGIEYEIKKIDEDQEALEFVKSLGFSQAPVVVIYRGGVIVSSWSGFNPDKILEIKSF
jgi:glutaredoxin-like protein NrdH